MALETEDGTGKANAESLCSLATATAYHAAMGNTAWAALASDALREQALRRATAYMGQAYGLMWSGVRVTATQALDWPRSYAARPEVAGYWPADAVPLPVINACAELALRAAAGPLLADQGREVSEQTVGPITTKYATGGNIAKRYAAVDAMLSGMLSGWAGGAVRQLQRA